MAVRGLAYSYTSGLGFPFSLGQLSFLFLWDTSHPPVLSVSVDMAASAPKVIRKVDDSSVGLRAVLAMCEWHPVTVSCRCG